MGFISISWKLRFSKVTRLVMRLNQKIKSGLGIWERNNFPPLPPLSLSLSLLIARPSEKEQMKEQIRMLVDKQRAEGDRYSCETSNLGVLWKDIFAFCLLLNKPNRTFYPKLSFMSWKWTNEEKKNRDTYTSACVQTHSCARTHTQSYVLGKEQTCLALNLIYSLFFLKPEYQNE